jgi:hypothetical protein
MAQGAELLQRFGYRGFCITQIAAQAYIGSDRRTLKAHNLHRVSGNFARATLAFALGFSSTRAPAATAFFGRI